MTNRLKTDMTVRAFFMVRYVDQSAGLRLIDPGIDEIEFGPPPGHPDAPIFDVIWPDFVAVAFLETTDSASHRSNIVVVNQAGKPVGVDIEGPVQFAPPTASGRRRCMIQSRTTGLVLECPGTYRCILAIDTEIKAEFPIIATRATG